VVVVPTWPTSSARRHVGRACNRAIVCQDRATTATRIDWASQLPRKQPASRIASPDQQEARDRPARAGLKQSGPATYFCCSSLRSRISIVANSSKKAKNARMTTTCGIPPDSGSAARTGDGGAARPARCRSSDPASFRKRWRPPRARRAPERVCHPAAFPTWPDANRNDGVHAEPVG
jgi:hypothetical protein